MKCPFCGGEMQHGWLHTGATIWSRRRHRLSYRPAAGEGYTLLQERPLLSFHYLESDWCPACEKLILDTAKAGRTARP